MMEVTDGRWIGLEGVLRRDAILSVRLFIYAVVTLKTNRSYSWEGEDQTA